MMVALISPHAYIAGSRKKEQDDRPAVAFSHAALSSPRRLHTNSAVYTCPPPPLLVIATPVPGLDTPPDPTPVAEEKKKTRQTVVSVFIRDRG
ncbi:hypothetical protein BJV78DRAFT_1184064, partial [Lactifluus subvellereus]